MDVFDTYYSSALSESKVAISAGDYETGRRKASAAISAKPTFDAYIERAECFIQLNNFLAARIDLDICLQIMKKRGRHYKDSAQRLKFEELVKACTRPAGKTGTSFTQAMCAKERIDPLSLLQTFELSHLRDTLSSLTQTAVRLSVGQQNPKRPEQSKFGGIPFGLPQVRIPKAENSPLPLLMQINLGELQKVFSGFPVQGFLYFFFDPRHCLGRTSFVEDRKSWRVVFYRGNNFESKTETEPDISIWKEKSIDLDFNVSLPAVLSPFIQSLALPL